MKGQLGLFFGRHHEYNTSITFKTNNNFVWQVILLEIFDIFSEIINYTLTNENWNT